MRASMKPLWLFFAWVVGVETVMSLLWAWSVSEGSVARIAGLYGLTMLYSGAVSFVGGLVGFLFGVPRSVAASNPAETSETPPQNTSLAPTAARPVASDKPPLPESGLPIAGPIVGPHLRVNTNLESLSDAVTKGLLAIGLTQVNNLGTFGRTVAERLGPSFAPGVPGQIFAISILVYGLISGFFFGYLLTRIYLTTVFADADPASNTAPERTRRPAARN